MYRPDDGWWSENNSIRSPEIKQLWRTNPLTLQSALGRDAMLSASVSWLSLPAFLVSNDLKSSKCDSRMSQFGSSGWAACGAGVVSSPTDWRVKRLAAWLKGDTVGLLTPTYPRYAKDWSVSPLHQEYKQQDIKIERRLLFLNWYAIFQVF
jgi:hypothetical protein